MFESGLQLKINQKKLLLNYAENVQMLCHMRAMLSWYFVEIEDLMRAGIVTLHLDAFLVITFAYRFGIKEST